MRLYHNTPDSLQLSKLSVEGRLSATCKEELLSRGHGLVIEDDWADGYLSASYCLGDGTLGAVASPRGQQIYAVGW